MASDSAPRSGRFRQALFDGLMDAGAAATHVEVLAALRSAAEAAHSTIDAAAAPEPESLAAVRVLALASGFDAALERAADLFDTPAQLEEAIYLARCLVREAASALRLLRLREYIGAALVPDVHPELQMDRQAVLDSTTFQALWQEPARAGWMEGVIAIWRRDYAVQYVKSHATYNAVLNDASQMADDLEPRAKALERLNRLKRLGPPVGERALGQLEEFRTVYPCPSPPAAVNHDLAASPSCSGCEFRLTDRATRADMRLVVRAVSRALEAQLARLSRRVVSRILDRPERPKLDDLEQFLRVVQASDLRGLASILDDGLLAFISDMLTSGDERDVLTEMAGAYPVVTLSNLDAVVSEFRRLLTDRLSSTGADVSLERSER